MVFRVNGPLGGPRLGRLLDGLDLVFRVRYRCRVIHGHVHVPVVHALVDHRGGGGTRIRGTFEFLVVETFHDADLTEREYCQTEKQT